MSLTKEMIMMIDAEVDSLSDDLLRVYNGTYRKLNGEYPNGFFKYRITKSDKELINRGLEHYCSDPFLE